MYSKNFALITSIYQLGARASVFTLDGRKLITDVSNDILDYFDRYGFNNYVLKICHISGFLILR